MKLDISQLEFIHPFLRKLIPEIEKHFGVEFTGTSLFRIGDNGVHGQLPLRGIDLRCKDESFGSVVQFYVNEKYEYDPSRPSMQCCMLHDSGGGLHLHLQAHSNTVER